ncbi:hypothetical protein GGF32_009929 [Allomyces javanicus]|nr:hypothetical protein GGF32_009929 [Allomyces javanicus]
MIPATRGPPSSTSSASTTPAVAPTSRTNSFAASSGTAPSAMATASGSTSTATPAKTPLFEVSLPAKLELDQVYWNGLHALHRFSIRSLCAEPLVIKLRSNLGAQVAFQLTNENLPDPDPIEGAVNAAWAVEAVAAAAAAAVSGSGVAIPPPPLPPPPLPLADTPTTGSGSNPPSLTKTVSSTSFSSRASLLYSPLSATSLTSLPDTHLSGASTPFELVPNPQSASATGSGGDGAGGAGGIGSGAHHGAASHPLHLVATTNTATAAALGAYASGGPYESNQLFNYVNHIDELHLDPFETCRVILAFLPNPPETHANGSGAAAGVAAPGVASSSASPSDDATHDFVSVSGMIMFYGFRESTLRPPPAATNDETTVTSPVSASPVDASSSADPAEPATAPVRSASATPGTTGTLPLSQRADFHTAVKFKARVCESVLWSDVAQNGLLFEDCVLGGTFLRDFTVWNRSEVDLYWVMNTADVPSCLSFCDYNTGEPIDPSKPIPAYSYCRVRVTYKPPQTGDFSYELQLENANDANNVEVVRVHCVVRSAEREESLVLLSGSQLDFGDICAGTWNTAKIVVKNVSESPVDVRFATEGDAPGMVVFNVQQQTLDLALDPTIDAMMRTDAVVSRSHGASSSTGHARGGGGGYGSPTVGRRGSPNLGAGTGGVSATSSRTGSPVPTRSVSMESASDASSPSPRPTSARRTGGTHTSGHHHFIDADDDDSDSESMVSTRSYPSLASLPASTNATGSTSAPVGLGLSSLSGAGGSSVGLASAGAGTGTSLPSGTSPTSTGAPTAGGAGGDHGSPTRGPQHIEELVLKPGSERTILVSYNPERANVDDYNAGHLVKRAFRVVLHYGKERKVVQCKARSCTSFISVTPAVVQFGDTDVGTLKSLPIKIHNLSDIAARVELSFASKVLSCHRDDLAIAPRQAVEVKIDIYPRKVNPDYRKQITVMNLLNRRNDQIVEVRSTNIDKQRITWHSLFYRIMTPKSTNYLDFGCVVGNHYSVRTFSVQNISPRDLTLHIASSHEHIQLYTKRASRPQKMSLQEKKHVFEDMADRKTIKRTNSDLLVPSNAETPAYLDLAVPKKQAQVKATAASGSALVSTVDEVVRILEHINIANLPVFPVAMEQKYVKLTLALRKSLDQAMRAGDLVPVSTSNVTIPPEKDVEFIAVLTAPGIKERRKKLDGRLLFQLVDYDAAQLPNHPGMLPVREFLVRAVLCPCTLEVGQRNINFGNVELQSEMHKTLVVRNKADVPVLYSIKKSGSIASGDLVIDHRLGIIQPHGAREVTFAFQPSMPGGFFEKMTVENVMNPENSQVILLKAQVKKPDSFSIHTESLDFGVCLVNEYSVARIVTLHNTHRQTRTFTVRVEEADEYLHFEFGAVKSETIEHQVEDVEEKIESLEQKLKIAKRKGRKDKVDKITETISKLRRGTDMIVSTSQDEVIPTPFPADRKAGSLTLPVEPHTIKKIAVVVRPKALIKTRQPAAGTMPCSGFIYIHHHKNTDILKKVPYSCVVCYDQAAFIDSLDHGSGGARISPPTAVPPFALPSPPSVLRPDADRPDLPELDHLDRLPASAIVAAPVPPPPPRPLMLETPVVELGKFTIGQEGSFYFVLINSNNVPVEYSTEDPAVGEAERHGQVAPNDRRVINATIVPTTSGKQVYKIDVQNQDQTLTFAVHFTAVYKDGLVLRPHDNPDSDPIGDIDLGYCYTSKKYTVRAAVDITNTMPEPVKVSVVSTLSQQAVMFVDADCQTPLADVPLGPGQAVVGYLAVQPNLASQLPIMVGKKSLVTYESRSLVGGFKFLCASAASSDEICTQHLKFQAVTGQSMFSVSSTFMNLGAITEIQDLTAAVTVYNLSDKMPLHYTVTSSNPDVIHVHEYPAVLQGSDAAANPDGTVASSRGTVTLTIRARGFGYIYETLTITNVHCPDVSTQVVITLLVDPHQLDIAATAHLPPAPVLVASTTPPVPVPLIQWNHIYVYPGGPAGRLVMTPGASAQQIRFTNESGHELRLFACSDSKASLTAMDPTIKLADAPVAAKWAPCSPIMIVPPNISWSCQVQAPEPPPQLTDDDVAALNQGRTIKIRGIMVFCHETDEQVVKVVEMLGYYCISRAEVVSKQVHVKARRGEQPSFTVTVKNGASCPCQLAVQCPSPIRYLGPPVLDLEPYASADLVLELDSTHLAGGHHEWNVTVNNLVNPANTMTVPVTAKVTCLDLTVSGGDLDADRALLLPPIPVPNLTGASLDAWCTLTNPQPYEVRITVAVELIQPLADLVQLQVLSRFSNSPINWLTLPGNGSIEVKVKAVVLDTARLTSSTPKWLLSDSGIQLGQVSVENEDGRFIVPVRGSLVEQGMFDVEGTTINVSVGASTTIAVTNLSPHHALDLGASLEMLHDIGPCEVHVPESVHVPPSTCVQVPLDLVKYDPDESGDMFFVHFQDRSSVKPTSKSVKLRVTEPVVAPEPVSALLIPDVVGADADEIISLKGCPRKGKLYELDLGQQDLGSGNVTRKLVLELNKSVKCQFRVKGIPPDPAEWLSVSKNEGVLDPSGSKSQSITLSFNTNIRNVFYTYLIIENVDYPHDHKYIKVSLEVVARVNVRKSRAFELVCNGLDDSPNIFFENVYYGHDYSSRSFIIHNREPIPLEFTLKLQNLAPSDVTEVLFSTSKSIPKLFRTVVVPAESSTRVYLRLRPAPGPTAPTGQLATPLPVGQASPPNDLQWAAAHSGFGQLLSPDVEVKEFDIVVNCRLVRDYQQVIHVKATCRSPQLKCPHPEVVLSALVTEDGSRIVCAQPWQDLTIMNLDAEHPLHVEMVMPGATLFLLEETPVVTLAPGEHRRVRVKLNIDEAQRQLDALRREKYVQEHMLVYNRWRCTERTFVTLKLSLGWLDDFSLQWWNTRTSPSFTALEADAYLLLRALNADPSLLFTTTPTPNDAIFFQFRVLIDQLVYMATITATVDHVLHLASLIFASILAHTPALDADDMWLDALRYFLSFFTVPHPVVESLRKLYHAKKLGGGPNGNGAGAGGAGGVGSAGN